MNFYINFPKEETLSTAGRNLKREAKIIDATCNWIIDQVEANLDKDAFGGQLLNFKEKLTSFMKASMEQLHCANLRTTNPTSRFYRMAKECNIPKSALPADISIIVNQEKSFYFKKHSAFQTFIFQ